MKTKSPAKRGCRNFVRATILSMSRQGLFFIPLVLTLPAYYGLFGVQVSQPISDVVSFLVAIPLEIGVLREMTREMRAMEMESGITT